MTVRTGFIGRSFIHFSTNVVAFGYGGVSDELIPLPEEVRDELQIGEPGPRVQEKTRRAPEFAMTGPAGEDERIPRPDVSAQPKDAPTPVTKVNKG